jgi:hypothetical protein
MAVSQQLAVTVTVTKLASSGNFLHTFLDANGGVIYQVSILSADEATFAALTSGNSATRVYAQGAQAGDYTWSAQETS